MKHFIQLASCLTLLVAVAMPAMAETNIAIVDIQQIMRDSSAAKSVRTQLESKQKAYQAELKKKEEAMQKEEQSLASQRATLSPEAFEKKVNDFRKKATEMQQDVQKKKAALDKGFEKALNEIQSTVNSIITELAKEKGFNVAIPSGQLLYHEPGMEITSEVLDRLNKKLPKVSVSFN